MMEQKTYYFHTEHLDVGYDGKAIIRDISFGIHQGEILTLIGPNGAGKTTILRSLIGQLEKIAGTVYLEQLDMKSLSLPELSRKLAVVLTERIRPEMMTCEDVVATGRYPYTGRFGILSQADHEKVKEAMELVHISELAGRDFLQTSDGQKQRVMLARAICQEPEILVLDEPTSFLDIRYKLEFLSIIQQMSRKKNLTVIMSLHELDLAGRISDKIACVKGDRVDRFGSPEEIFSGDYVSGLYHMTVGSYDERSGNLELERVQGEPEAFVFAGGGTGTSLFRRLQREQTPFAVGILWENDLDYPSARALASLVISLPPFAEISEQELNLAKNTLKKCSRIYCTLPGDMKERLPEKLRELIDDPKTINC